MQHLVAGAAVARDLGRKPVARHQRAHDIVIGFILEAGRTTFLRHQDRIPARLDFQHGTAGRINAAAQAKDQAGKDRLGPIPAPKGLHLDLCSRRKAAIIGGWIFQRRHRSIAQAEPACRDAAHLMRDADRCDVVAGIGGATIQSQHDPQGARCVCLRADGHDDSILPV